MGLGDKSLGAGFMNQTFGANSTPDEMEYMKLRASDGGRFGVSSLYEETGSMPIAKSLARHYKKGGRRYQEGGRLKPPANGEWYTQDEINLMSENEYNQMESLEGDYSSLSRSTPAQDTVDNNSRYESDKAAGDELLYRGLVDEYNDMSTEELLNLSPYQSKKYDEALKYDRILKMNNDIDGMKGDVENYNQAVPYSNDPSGGQQSTTVAPNAMIRSAQEKEAMSTEIPIENNVENTNNPSINNGTRKAPVDPRLASRSLTDIGNSGMQGTPGTMSDPYKLDSSIIGNTVAPEVATPDLGPNWWDENRNNIARGASNVGAGFLNVAPHLGNIKRYNNMPGVRAPNLSKTVKTEAPSFESSRQAIIAQGNNAANRAQGQSQSNQLAANIASMSGTQSALSQLGGQEAQAVAANDASNAQASNQNNARNTQALNKNLEQQTSRELAQIRGISNEWGNIANKSLGFMGDMNRQKLDRERMDLTRQAYNQQGQLDRAALKQFEETGRLPEYYRPTNKNNNG